MVLFSFCFALHFTFPMLESCERVRAEREPLWGLIPCLAFGCSTWQFCIFSGYCVVFWHLHPGYQSFLTFHGISLIRNNRCLWNDLLAWETSLYFPFIPFVIFADSRDAGEACLCHSWDNGQHWNAFSCVLLHALGQTRSLAHRSSPMNIKCTRKMRVSGRCNSVDLWPHCFSFILL